MPTSLKAADADQFSRGSPDDGVTSGLKTLQMLIDAIKAVSGVTYSPLEIAPIDLQDGGAPGGNIRPGTVSLRISYINASRR